MIRTGIIGLGKMGISHCSIINAHPEAKLVAVCDTSKLVLSAIKKYSGFECFTDYKEMIDKCDLDCVFVASPTKFHAPMVNYALERDIHVFCEKPFCLNHEEGESMVRLAEKKGLVNQVGYHNRFIGTFQETKRLLDKGVIGDIYHFLGEAYGPVVLKEKGATWRSDRQIGGGCLYDYASHVINLIGYLIGSPKGVVGTALKSVYSKNVEDAVYSTLKYSNGLSGQISVNWSDESYRKMSTQISVFGKLGKISADVQECKIYLREENEKENLEKGWNIRYITDVTKPVAFNLRGEEYSAQVDYFIGCVINNKIKNVNSFASALETDVVIDQFIRDAESGD